MKKDEKSSILTKEDYAWQDFRQRHLSRHRDDYSDRVFETKSIDETIEMAFREGWRSGREKLLDRIAERLKTQLIVNILGDGK